MLNANLNSHTCSDTRAAALDQRLRLSARCRRTEIYTSTDRSCSSEAACGRHFTKQREKKRRNSRPKSSPNSLAHCARGRLIGSADFGANTAKQNVHAQMLTDWRSLRGPSIVSSCAPIVKRSAMPSSPLPSSPSSAVGTSRGHCPAAGSKQQLGSTGTIHPDHPKGTMQM